MSAALRREKRRLLELVSSPPARVVREPAEARAAVAAVIAPHVNPGAAEVLTRRALEVAVAVHEQDLPRLPSLRGEGLVVLRGGAGVGYAFGQLGRAVVLGVLLESQAVVTVGAARGATPWAAWGELAEGPGPALVGWARGWALDRVALPIDVALELAGGRS